jgi:hypothetical protein
MSDEPDPLPKIGDRVSFTAPSLEVDLPVEVLGYTTLAHVRLPSGDVIRCPPGMLA